jgi:hypothetical protein
MKELLEMPGQYTAELETLPTTIGAISAMAI